jgi:hypothetical protein
LCNVNRPILSGGLMCYTVVAFVALVKPLDSSSGLQVKHLQAFFVA